MDVVGFVTKRAALTSVSALALCCGIDAVANPQGGNVVGGSATITSTDKKLDVHQHSNKAIINWQKFDIDVDEHTQFHQPSSSSTALNRVQSADPSKILGKLSANGNIILINPNGVFFGKDSIVDVNGIIATTADINDADFMNGNLNFNIPGNPWATISNEGMITAKEAGLVGLVAPNVLNSGIITAKLGKVHLASGDTFALDLYGDGLYSIKVSDEVASQLVGNIGEISAEGGTIAITAAAAKEIVNSLIFIEGSLKANSVGQKGGKIIISAEGANAIAGNISGQKGVKLGSSKIVLSDALLDASGRDEGEQGGQIEILADNINIMENVVIDASGHSAPVPVQKPDGGTATMTADKEVRSEDEFLAHENRAGGSIKIGGDYLGKGDTAAAKSVYVDPDSLILNDAMYSGDGGRTVIWSDDTTGFYGNVYARGGINGGNGGFLETSGKEYLDALGFADLTTRYEGYKKGTYLLDPSDIVIYGNVDPTFTSTDASVDLSANLQLWLDANDTDGDNVSYADDSDENAGALSTWVDKSGNGNDATGGTGITIGGSTQNGRNVVTFDGTGYFELPSTAILSATSTAIVGLYTESTKDENRLLTSDYYLEHYGVGTHGGKSYGKNPNYKGRMVGNDVISQSTIITFWKDATNDILYENGGFIGSSNFSDGHYIRRVGSGFEGNSYDIIVHTEALSDNNRYLLEQYQSAKWGIELQAPGTGANEAAKAMASDGYSVFATDYLERLSATADIVLQADNTITLDFQGDSLDLTDDRSITLQTTNGDISTASTGTINTNRTTTGGNMSFISGSTGNIVFDHAMTLNSQGGDITFNSGTGAIALTNASINTSGGDITLGGDYDPDGGGPLSGFALGTAAHDIGIDLNNSDLSAGAGDVSLKGRTKVSSIAAVDSGILLRNSSSIVTTSGDIDLYAMSSTGGTGHQHRAFDMSNSSITSTSGNITITGEATNTGNHPYAVHINDNSTINNTSGEINILGYSQGGADSEIIALGTGSINSVDGDISLYAEKSNQQIMGISFLPHFVNNGNFDILTTGSADITFTVNGASDDIEFHTSGTTIGGASATGNITFNVDDFDSALVASTGTVIQTTGKVIFTPYTALTTIGVSGGTGDIDISDDLLSYIHSDVSGIQIGRSGGTGDIEVAAHDWGGDNVEFYSGSGVITFTGDQTNLANFTVDTDAGFAVDNMLSGSGDFLITAGGLLTFNDQIVTTSASQNGLVVSTEDDFINNVGSNVFSAVNSRWLLYSSDPANNIRGGLLPDASDFGKTYASDAPNTIGSGNRFIYSTSNVPTLTFQVGDDAITYGESLSASSVYVSGLLAGDTLNNIGQTGEATYLTNYSSAGTTAIVATQGGLFNVLGYAYNFLDGQATIEKTTLEVALENVNHSRVRYSSDPSYGITFSGFKLGDDASVIDSLPIASSGATHLSPAGLYQIFLSGGLDDSYEFSFSNPSGTLEITNIELPKSVEKVGSNIKTRILGKDKSKIRGSNVTDIDFDFDFKEYRKDERNENKTIKIMGGLVEISPEVAEMLGIKEGTLFYNRIK